ncbi:Protein of unknown function [Gryllus bimaculatus]|nr:Protein of unknown function [Gryllus bimaculatus]
MTLKLLPDIKLLVGHISGLSHHPEAGQRAVNNDGVIKHAVRRVDAAKRQAGAACDCFRTSTEVQSSSPKLLSTPRSLVHPLPDITQLADHFSRSSNAEEIKAARRAAESRLSVGAGQPAAPLVLRQQPLDNGFLEEIDERHGAARQSPELRRPNPTDSYRR